MFNVPTANCHHHVHVRYLGCHPWWNQLHIAQDVYLRRWRWRWRIGLWEVLGGGVGETVLGGGVGSGAGWLFLAFRFAAIILVMAILKSWVFSSWSFAGSLCNCENRTPIIPRRILYKPF